MTALYNLFSACALAVMNTAEPPGMATDGVQPAEPFRDAAGTLMIGVVLFLLALYAIYLLYKYVLSKRLTPGLGLIKSKNMRVIEITPVGPGSTVQLVKVADEYFLIGVTKNQITFLTKTGYVPLTENNAEEGKEPVFERYLNRIFKRNAQGDSNPAQEQDDGKEGNAKEGNEEESSTKEGNTR